MEKKKRAIDTIYLAALLAWVAFYSYPFFFESLSHNVREIQSYNLDSMMMLNAVQDALASRYFRFTFNDYGHFYFNVVIVLSYLYSILFPLTEHAVFFILRLVSLLGGCLTIALVFLFSRRFLGRLEAYFAATLMAFTPALITYSNEVKPDTWQIFFITLSLFFCAHSVSQIGEQTDKNFSNSEDRHRRTLHYLFAAAAAAGAAFGTKYLGVLLLPLIASAVIVAPPTLTGDRAFAFAARWIGHAAAGLAAAFLIVAVYAQPQRLTAVFPLWGALDANALHLLTQIVRYCSFTVAAVCIIILLAHVRGFDFKAYRRLLIAGGRLIAIGLLFFAVFAITSPWNALQMAFVPQFFFRTGYLSAGHFGFEWLPFLFGYKGYAADFIGKGPGALAILAGLFIVIALLRRNYAARYLRFLFVFGFALIFIVMVVAVANRSTVLYGLPIIPPLVLLAAFGVSELQRVMTRLAGVRTAKAAALSLAVALIATQVWQGAYALMKYPLLIVALTPDNQKLSEWLGRCVPTDAKILAGSFSYVPPRFNNTIMADNFDNFERFDPNVVILNMNLVERVAKELASDKLDYYTADRDHLYQVVMRSGKWWVGPLFGNWQVYVAPAFKLRIEASCDSNNADPILNAR